MTVPRTAAVDGQQADGADAGRPDTAGPDTDRAREQARLRLRRGRLVTAVVAAVLAVVVGIVALLGGFRARTDLFRRVAPGSVIAAGPYEVTLATATSQHHTSDDTWTVVVSGTARTTGTTSIAPGTGDAGFVYARDAAGGKTQATYSVELGADPTAYPQPDNLTPGLPPAPWSVTFRFPSPPGDSVLVAVFDQEYTTPYLFDDEEGWRPTNQASTMTLPLQPLPDVEF